MGKGDRKTRRGKIRRGTTGRTRAKHPNARKARRAKAAGTTTA